jgi:hypothetical protein
MKPIRSLTLVLLCLCGFVAQAQAHTKYKSQTRNSSASFSSYANDDCSYSSIYVQAFEEESRGGNQSYAADVVYVDYSSYDYCTGEQSWGWAYFDGASFDVQKLKSASVDVVDQMYLSKCHYTDGGGGGGGTGGVGGVGGIGGSGGGAGMGGAAGAAGGSADGGMGWGGYECTDSYVSLVVDLNWKASGVISKDRSNQTYSSPNGTYRYRYTGQSVDATISGALIIDGVDVSLSDSYAGLGHTTSGYFEMYH